MTGCTYSQHAVARMMTRMRNLDDVTEVTLAKSERKEDTIGAAGGGPGVATTDSQAPQDIQDCIGSSARHEVRPAGRVRRRRRAEAAAAAGGGRSRAAGRRRRRSPLPRRAAGGTRMSMTAP